MDTEVSHLGRGVAHVDTGVSYLGRGVTHMATEVSYLGRGEAHMATGVNQMRRDVARSRWHSFLYWRRSRPRSERQLNSEDITTKCLSRIYKDRDENYMPKFISIGIVYYLFYFLANVTIESAV